MTTPQRSAGSAALDTSWLSIPGKEVVDEPGDPDPAESEPS
jgi:hypothetical protein